jgi:hypothetical protein
LIQSLKTPFFLLTGGLRLTGCQLQPHAPTVDVLGSYFPAWIICAVLGLALTLVARQILIGLKLAAHLVPAPLIYVCLVIVFTLAVWLALFQN